MGTLMHQLDQEVIIKNLSNSPSAMIVHYVRMPEASQLSKHRQLWNCTGSSLVFLKQCLAS